MSGDHDDDEALSWAGDEDPSLVAPGTLPPGWTTVGSNGATAAIAVDASETNAHAEQPTAMGPVALVTLGVIGGMLLLYTVGWVISFGQLSENASSTYEGDPLGGFMFMLGGWLAIIAPAVWMCTTLWLTREGRQRGRILWLVLGIVVLLPWPLLIGA